MRMMPSSTASITRPGNSVTPDPNWLAHLRHEEGFRRVVYQCSGGVWTIGYGHTGPEITATTPPATDTQIATWLQADAAEAMAQALGLSPGLVAAAPARLAAVADFCFNCGPHAYANSTFRRCIDAGNWVEAAAQNQRWVFAKKVRQRGLVRRRAVTSTWLLEGAW